MGDGQAAKLIAWQREVVECVGRYRLHIVLHNTTIPRGWDRTCPHLLGVEAGIAGAHYSNPKALADQIPSRPPSRLPGGLVEGRTGSSRLPGPTQEVGKREPGRDLEFVVDAGQVCLHRAGTEEEPLGDLSGAQTRCREFGDLPFAVTEQA